MFQAFVCEATTGKKLAMIPASSFTWSKLMSAGGAGEVSLVLDGSFTQAQLGDLFRHWNRIFVLEFDGKVLYGGYITSHTYSLGSDKLTASLTDLWGLAGKRLGVDGGFQGFQRWSVTRTVSLAQHAADALIRARDTPPASPDPAIPVTIPGFGGTAVKRTWYGYNAQTVADMWRLLLDEGLDIFFQPRWIGNGDFDWLMHAGPSWRSARTHEYFVTADQPGVSEFSTTYDGARITTNAIRVGEGSEQDMLIGSHRKLGSPFPLLERVTASKSANAIEQLWAMCENDVAMYGGSTAQWEFKVPVSADVEVGDLVTLHFDGDFVIPDGFTTRRVVSVSGDMSEFMTVAVQPAGGA